MKFTPIDIEGAFLVELEPHVDERGSFARAFCRREFEEQGIEFQVLQANLARTNQAGVVRGLHYQDEGEQKLVRCVAGAVHDVLVDMRPASPTHRNVVGTRLDNDNRLALFVPGGVAHGYQALEDGTEFMYLTDQFYTPGLEKGVRYSDPALAIDWPLAPRDVADRDESWPLLGPP